MRPLDPVTYLAVLALMSNVALVTYALPELIGDLNVEAIPLVEADSQRARREAPGFEHTIEVGQALEIELKLSSRTSAQVLRTRKSDA